MSYLVLARKYRPTLFGDVAGQDVTTGILRGAIQEERVGHAYLFSGPRGTGKTTTARIFAKALNCEKGPTADPCGECERCLSTDAGSEMDIVEIDAASNRGIDSIKDLRDQVAYVPMRARFKVYIIDEVHMLTKEAFNALLKTLEEPPAHAKFLFATTEKHKVPDTILSRCQVLLLDPISEVDIVGRLTKVSELEKLTPGPGVLEELARRARGGMRDALSLFDQLLALVGDEPALEDVERLGGEGGAREIEELLALVEKGDRAGVMTAIRSVGGGESELLESLLDQIRLTLFVSLCGADHPILGSTPSEEIVARSSRLSHDRLELWLEELLHARGRLRQSQGHERLVLELALLELCRAENSIPLVELERRLLALEARLGEAPPPTSGPSEVRATAPKAPASAEPVRASAPAPAPRPTPTPTSAPTSAPAPQAQPTESKSGVYTPPVTNRDTWELVLKTLKEKHGALAELLETRGRLDEVTETQALLHLELGSDADRRMVEGKRNKSALTRAFSQALGREVAIEFGSRVAVKAPEKDPFTEDVASLFGGKVEESQ